MPISRDLSPKQPFRSPLHRSRKNSHTQPTSDFGSMLLSALLEPCSAAPASYQNPCVSIKHYIQEQSPSWLQDQYLCPTPKFQSQSNKEEERRSRTKRHLPPSPQQPAAAHWEAKEIWRRGEPSSFSPTWELYKQQQGVTMARPSQLAAQGASTAKPSEAKRSHLTQEAPSGTGVEVNRMGRGWMSATLR